MKVARLSRAGLLFVVLFQLPVSLSLLPKLERTTTDDASMSPN